MLYRYPVQGMRSEVRNRKQATVPDVKEKDQFVPEPLGKAMDNAVITYLNFIEIVYQYRTF